MPSVLRVLGSAVARVHRHNGILYAGHMAFTAMLSFFPFLIFLTALAGFAGEPEGAQAFVQRVFALVPEKVSDALYPAVEEVLMSRHGGLLTFSLVGALWVASSGVEAIRHVLNQSYSVVELRPFWQRRLESLAVVITGGTLTLVLSLGVILGPAIWSIMTSIVDIPPNVASAVGTAQDLVSVVIIAIILTILHAYLPCRRQRLRDVWPGALLTAVLWIGLATAFSLYLANLNDFNVTYGSLGGVVLTLVYFHVSAVLFIFGAELNAAIQTRSRPANAPAAPAA
jgi:membrane protein